MYNGFNLKQWKGKGSCLEITVILLIDKYSDLFISRCWGQKPTTMIPTDCYVLWTQTILPNICIIYNYYKLHTMNILLFIETYYDMC